MDKALVDYYDIKPGKVIVSIQTRREDVERRAKDLIAGRASDEKYPLLARFLVVSLNCRDEVLPAEYHTIRASQGTKVP